MRSICGISFRRQQPLADCYSCEVPAQLLEVCLSAWHSPCMAGLHRHLLLPKGPEEPGRRSPPVDPSVLPIIRDQHPAPARHQQTGAELTNDRLASRGMAAKRRGFFGKLLSPSLGMEVGTTMDGVTKPTTLGLYLPPPLYSLSPTLLSDAEKTSQGEVA